MRSPIDAHSDRHYNTYLCYTCHPVLIKISDAQAP